MDAYKLRCGELVRLASPLLTKEHKVKWIAEEVAFVSSDGNEIILAGDDKLRRVKDK